VPARWAKRRLSLVRAAAVGRQPPELSSAAKGLARGTSLLRVTAFEGAAQRLVRVADQRRGFGGSGRILRQGGDLGGA